MKFHSGEITVQEKAGVRQGAERVGRSISTTVPQAAADFLERQPLLFAGFADAEGSVWASVLTGSPGTFHAQNARSVAIDAKPTAGDPLTAVWKDGLPVGLLAIEPQTRRRMRVNGHVKFNAGAATVITDEVYANCPKYIQARHWEEREGVASHSVANDFSNTLTQFQRQWIERSDTFFIASANPLGGADISHRGGKPGFIHVDNDLTTITFPDYAGNNMFNTLGNIEINPRAGLLFIDFDSGSTLQLTGPAHVVWDTAQLKTFAGAQRLVVFRISRAIERQNGVPLRWEFVNSSPFNP